MQLNQKSMEIKISGAGCPDGNTLYETVKYAIGKLKIDALVMKEKGMTKNILYALLAVFTLISCGNNPKAKVQATIENNQGDYIEILYFHGKQRCVTCNAIEKLTKEVVEKDFAKQLENGEIVFEVIDISTKEGEKIADKYEVAWSSLYINKWEGGRETKNNMTDFGFSYAKSSPDVFKAGIKEKMDELLK